MEFGNKEKIFFQIEKLCKQRHVRLTPQRRKILHLISQENNAIRAYRLLHLLHKSSPEAKPSTIYRTLKFLLSQGFIHKIESMSSFILCHHFSSKHSNTYIFFICKECQKVTEKTTNQIEKILQNIAKKINFTITYNIIEIYGICLNCKKKYK